MLEKEPLRPDDGTQWIVDAILGDGKQLSDETRARILDLSAPAIPPLLALLQNDDLAMSDAPGNGRAPIHAAGLLGELRAAAAVEPMLRILAENDWMSILHSRIIFALKDIGQPALEPTLRALARTDCPDDRRAFTEVITGLGIEDPRVLSLLLEELERNPEAAAAKLAEYRDPRALPALLSAFDAYEVDPDCESLLPNHALVELAAAIEELGGALSPEQHAKLRQVRQQKERITARLEACVSQPRPCGRRSPGKRSQRRRKRKLQRKARKRNR